MSVNETPGCIVETIVIASGLFLCLLGLSVLAGCGGQQLSDHAAVTAACISEDRRITTSSVTQEEARERLAPLRAACATLLDTIEERDAGIHGRP